MRAWLGLLWSLCGELEGILLPETLPGFPALE
jgi:hypothetical protein